MSCHALLLAAEGGGLTDIHLPTIIWAWVKFGVTFWLLTKIAWPMLAKKMEEREIRIREGLDLAQKMREEAATLLERQEQVLVEARAEAQNVISEGRAVAEKMKSEATEAAAEEIAEERERARKEITLERAKAVDEVKRAAVDLVLGATGQLLQREIRDEDHRKLAAAVLDQAERLA